MDETQKSNKLVNHIERNILSLLSVKNDDESKGEEYKPLVASGKEDEEKQEDGTKSEDDESNIEEFIKFNSKEQDISNVTSKQKDKATTEDDDDDVKEIIQDDISICCRSEASNNSISSFTFPMYKFAMFFFRECLLVTQEHMSPNYVSLNQKLILVLYLFLPDCITKKMKVSQCRR